MQLKSNIKYDKKTDFVACTIWVDKDLQEKLREGVVDIDMENLDNEDTTEMTIGEDESVIRYRVRRPIGRIDSYYGLFAKELIDTGKTTYHFESNQNAESFINRLKTAIKQVLEEIYLMNKEIDMTIDLTISKGQNSPTSL